MKSTFRPIFIRENAFIILICAVAAIAVFLTSGAEKTFLLALLTLCAYFNALFLRAPLRVFKSPGIKSLAILVGMLGTNIALIVLLKFNPLISLFVWLPALAGVVVARVNSESRGN